LTIALAQGTKDLVSRWFQAFGSLFAA